ncbi:MAG: lysophospholipid acyltransferase family protein [Bacteroidales bacterium]|jgi:KDO2-lipid IV(A) lauroyltransferase|nr:lysophospholipid acyltransferase family protein [Bacteroidales bacterium]
MKNNNKKMICNLLLDKLQIIANYGLFYGVLMPLSLLPFSILYKISDILRYVLQYIIRYRKEVIEENLKHSFSNKNNNEINKIVNQYYKHLADIIVETIKGLTLREKNILKRYKCINKKLLYPYREDNQSIILLSSHYNNWEYMVLSIALQFNFLCVEIGKKQSNNIIGELWRKRRMRYGTGAVNEKQLSKVLDKKTRIFPLIYMFLADQYPNNDDICYNAYFLNQDTHVIYGPEYLAKKYNLPVFFYYVNKVRRGYYEFFLEKITDTPRGTTYGYITETYLSKLSSQINSSPQYWQWSHKR